MATITTTQGRTITGCYATTHNSASSYGIPVWVDAEGNAYMQVGLDNPFYTLDLDVEEQRKHLGEVIRNLRMRLGLTIESLSQASGIAVANISKLERGGTANTETIAKIASAMGKTLTII